MLDRIRAGGIPLILALSGVGSGADTLTVPPDSGGAPLNGYIVIASGAADGKLILTVSLPTIGSKDSATLTIKDTRAPSIGSALLTSVPPLKAIPMPVGGSNTVFVTGATDSLTVTASDNHALQWIGWTLGAPANAADSVEVTGDVGATVTFPVAIPTGIAGDQLTLSTFAVDEDGNRTTASFAAAPAADFTTHPIRTAARGAAVADGVFDATRGVVYLAKPDSGIVAVLSLGTMVYQSPIAVPGTPVSLDMTPDGDSLVVGLATPPQIAVVDLTNPAHPVVAVAPIGSYATAANAALTSLRVSADGPAIAELASGIEPYSTEVAELNLATAGARVVDSLFGQCCEFHMVRSGDGSSVLLANVDIPTGGSLLYASATQTYNDERTVTHYIGANVFTSASTSGSVYQFHHHLFDASLNDLGFFDLAGISYPLYGAAVSPNGADMYAAEAQCAPVPFHPCADSAPGFYLHFAVAGTRLMELVAAPQGAYEMLVSPDGTTLVGIGGTSITAFDLTHATPAPPASTIALHGVGRTPRSTLRTPPRFAIRFAKRVLRPLTAP